MGLAIGALLGVSLAAPADAAPSQVITASFDPVSAVLSVSGDEQNNTIEISRDRKGRLKVNGGAVKISGGKPTVANTSLIQVFAQGGNDASTLNENNGALPRANLFGGTGNDSLTGGSAGDMLFGQAGDDTLFGMGGADALFGGSENDTLAGGDGDDQVFGESGDDRLVWNPGDDSDLNEGGAGVDTIEVNGEEGAEVFVTTANDTRVRFDRLEPAPFALDIGTSEQLALNARGGDDRFATVGNLAALIQSTVDGGAGNDTLLGSNGADLLLGGDDDDFVDGQQGDDVALLGGGDDTFQWDAGDGSDTIEGQAGADGVHLNGSNGSENFDLSANSNRVRFTRDLGNIVLDLDAVEHFALRAFAGTDSIVVNDLSGTNLAELKSDLAGPLGGGDAQPDIVIVNATDANETIEVLGSGASYAVAGLPTSIQVVNAEGNSDSLVVNARAGDDSVDASALVAGTVRLTLDGGANNDTLQGSNGADLFIAGDGGDVVAGRQGDDIALLGSGEDTFKWEPGDGSDTVEGQDGRDTLVFNGSDAPENVDIAADNGRVRLFRNIDSVSMDLDDIEQIDLAALGGADMIAIGDLSGADLLDANLSLASAGGDGQADMVAVNGTQGGDQFGATSNAGGIIVGGLAATINIFNQEQAGDRLMLNALGGADIVDATSLGVDSIQLIINGGLGDDQLRGSAGADYFTGGDGNDLALMGGGDDTFGWNAGDDNDTLEGQAGADTLQFNGSNAAENIDIAANGGRVRLLRDVASVVMDLADVEGLNVVALGGADTIAIGDLSGTAVTAINTALQSSLGGGDGLSDRVIVNGTSGDDAVSVLGGGGDARVSGLAAGITITGAEFAIDWLELRTLAGADAVNATGLATPGIGLLVDAGAGNDEVFGSAGGDVLLGREDDDTLEGRAGDDTLDGGDGFDLLIGGEGADLFFNGEVQID